MHGTEWNWRSNGWNVVFFFWRCRCLRGPSLLLLSLSLPLFWLFVVVVVVVVVALNDSCFFSFTSHFIYHSSNFTSPLSSQEMWEEEVDEKEERERVREGEWVKWGRERGSTGESVQEQERGGVVSYTQPISTEKSVSFRSSPCKSSTPFYPSPLSGV